MPNDKPDSIQPGPVKHSAAVGIGNPLKHQQLSTAILTGTFARSLVTIKRVMLELGRDLKGEAKPFHLTYKSKDEETVLEVIPQYIRTKWQDGTCGTKTLENYMGALTLFEAYLAATDLRVPFDVLDRNDLMGYFKFLSGLGPNRQSQVRRAQVVIKELFARSFTEGILDRNPARLIRLQKINRGVKNDA